jgi:hypothetical protein
VKRLLLLAIACVACSETSEKWAGMSQSERQIALDAIADDCRLDGSAFILRPDDELGFQPGPDSNYESVRCSLEKLKKLRGFGKMGFIGNEAIRPEE